MANIKLCLLCFNRNQRRIRQPYPRYCHRQWGDEPTSSGFLLNPAECPPGHCQPGELQCMCQHRAGSGHGKISDPDLHAVPFILQLAWHGPRSRPCPIRPQAGVPRGTVSSQGSQQGAGQAALLLVVRGLVLSLFANEDLDPITYVRAQYYI